MNPALNGTERDTPSRLRVLGGESHHWFRADCLEFINPDAQTTTGNYLGLSKQMRQHWEKVGINPSDLIASHEGSSTVRAGVGRRKVQPDTAGIGSGRR